MSFDDTLFIIPARGGSKRVPRKNIYPLLGIPMILYTIKAVREVASDSNICVSTDDIEIKEVVEKSGLSIPFLRPKGISTDSASSREVILHAVDFYKKERRVDYAKVCLLQPTSPLRNSRHIREALMLWKDDLDMIVSVNESKENPYYNLFEEDMNGFLKKCKSDTYRRSQDIKKVWAINGAIYLINTNSLKKCGIDGFLRIKKYIMKKMHSIDIDDQLDIMIAEMILRNIQ